MGVSLTVSMGVEAVFFLCPCLLYTVSPTAVFSAHLCGITLRSLCNYVFHPLKIFQIKNCAHFESSFLPLLVFYSTKFYVQLSPVQTPKKAGKNILPNLPHVI
jgi:hypothetical protein